MNNKMLSIFPLLLITSFVFALKTDMSSYWDDLQQKAKAKSHHSYQKMKNCENDFMDGSIYAAHYKIFSACASLDKVPSMQNICQQNNQELINTLQKAKKKSHYHYKKYKQSLKAYAYDWARSVVLYEISERCTIYKNQWNKERAIEYTNKIRPKTYSIRLSERFLETLSDYPEYVKEDIERAITDVLNLIEEYDKIHNDNNEIQVNI